MQHVKINIKNISAKMCTFKCMSINVKIYVSIIKNNY